MPASTPSWIDGLFRQRRYAYATVYCHPYLPHPAFSAPHGGARPGLDPALATTCKNESNCTVLATGARGIHSGWRWPAQRRVKPPTPACASASP